MKCMKKDCGDQASYRAQFHLHQVVDTDIPVLVFTELYVCKDHATEQTGRNILNDNTPGREQLDQAFATNNLAPIDWARSKTKWIDIL